MQEDNTIREFLLAQGHPPEAIARIVEKLEQYDEKTVRESVFDSIERGSFDIDSIIQKAINEAQVSE